MLVLGSCGVEHPGSVDVLPEEVVEFGGKKWQVDRENGNPFAGAASQRCENA